MSKSKLLKISEIAELLNVKESWIRRQIFKKTIPHYKVGALIRFNQKEIESWIIENSANPELCQREISEDRDDYTKA